MGDLPLHESLVALLKHMGDDRFVPHGMYVRNFGPPNQLFHWAAWMVALFAPTDLACKVVVAGTLFAAAPAAARLARYAGTTPWSAVLVAPLALGFAFRWGLVGNLVGLPVLLLALPALDRCAVSPTPRNVLTSVTWALVSYLAHESILLVFGLGSLLFAFLARPRPGPRQAGPVERRSSQGLILALLPAVVSLTLAGFYAFWGQHLKAPSILAVPDSFGPPATARLLAIPGVLFGSAHEGETIVLFAGFGLAAGVLGAAGCDGRARRPVQRRLAWLGMACLGLYFGFPFSLGGSTLLYPRFLSVGCVLIAVALAPRAGERLSLAVRVGVAALPLAVVLLLLPRFGEAARRFGDLDDVLPWVAEDSAVAAIDLTPRPPSEVAPIPGAAGRVLAARGGRLLFSFTDAPTSPVLLAPALQWNEPVLRMMRDPTAFVPGHDFRRFRYALVRLETRAHELGPLLAAAMAPEGRLVRCSGEWWLFESTVPRVPLESPDSPLPDPRPSTLRERIGGLGGGDTP
jgi:hypothetical protein